MFDNINVMIVKQTKEVFWEEFQDVGVSREVFDVLFNNVLKKIRNKNSKGVFTMPTNKVGC